MIRLDLMRAFWRGSGQKVFEKQLLWVTKSTLIPKPQIQALMLRIHNIIFFFTVNKYHEKTKLDHKLILPTSIVCVAKSDSYSSVPQSSTVVQKRIKTHQ